MNFRYNHRLFSVFDLFFRKKEIKNLELILDGIGDVVVILTVWKRNYLEEQIKALTSQSIKPANIWVIKYENHLNTKLVLAKYPGVKLIDSSINLKYFGRFSIAQFVNTKYVWILDDDVIPGEKWIEKCLNLSSIGNYIISCAGRRIPKNTYFLGTRNEMHKHYFGDITPGYNYHFCKENTLVDFGCNGWFFQTEWIRTFWQVPPLTLEMSEDMHLSAICKLKLGVQTIVLGQLDEGGTGNLKIAYGRDQFASWTKPGFYEKRENVLNYLIDDLGWRPILWDNGNNTQPK